MTRSPPAFTLLELLISLLIIALLLALLLPALSSVRASAKATACAANLHALGQALHAYQTDYNTLPTAAVMPAPFDTVYKSHYPGPPIHLPLAPYIPANSTAYRCPTDFNQVYIRVAAASPIHAGISYVYFESLNRVIAARGDVNDSVMWDYQGDGKNVISPQLHPGAWSLLGGMNTLYHDGSVRFFPSRKP